MNDNREEMCKKVLKVVEDQLGTEFVVKFSDVLDSDPDNILLDVFNERAFKIAPWLFAGPPSKVEVK